MLAWLKRLFAPNRREINKRVSEEQIRAFHLLNKIVSKYNRLDFRDNDFRNLTDIKKIKKFIQMVDNDIDIKALGEALGTSFFTLRLVDVLGRHLSVANNVRKIEKELFLPEPFLTRIYEVDYFRVDYLRDVFVGYLFKYTSIFLPEEIQKEIIKRNPTELESASAPEGSGTELESAQASEGRGTEMEAENTPNASA